MGVKSGHSFQPILQADVRSSNRCSMQNFYDLHSLDGITCFLVHSNSITLTAGNIRSHLVTSGVLQQGEPNSELRLGVL